MLGLGVGVKLTQFREGSMGNSKWKQVEDSAILRFYDFTILQNYLDPPWGFFLLAILTLLLSPPKAAIFLGVKKCHFLHTEILGDFAILQNPAILQNYFDPPGYFVKSGCSATIPTPEYDHSKKAKNSQHDMQMPYSRKFT